VGTVIQGLLVLNKSDYIYHRWHGSLIGLAYLIFAITSNTLLARKLPLIEAIFVFFHILGIAIIIPLWALSPRAAGGSPLVDFNSPLSGWESNGIATLIGSATPIAALIGFDCSVHMCMFDLLNFL
jgi:choline transport protein